MSRPHRSLVAGLLVALLALPACSEDSADDPGRRDGQGAGQGAGRSLATQARLGEVVGRVPVAERRAALRRSRAVVDGWIDAAYVAGEWPRASYPRAFAGFTPGARRQARGDLRLLTNAGIGRRVDSVRATQRRVTYDVLASRRRVAGVTARVQLRYRTTGEVRRTFTVRGRLFLTPTRQGWRVFGYDLTKGSRR